MVAVIVIIIVALIVFVTLARTIRVVPQARAAVVERLGRYSRTLSPGLTLVVPFIDRIRATIDLREQVVSFPPQPVITEDNLVVSTPSSTSRSRIRSRRRTRSRTTSRRSSSSRSRRCAT